MISSNIETYAWNIKISSLFVSVIARKFTCKCFLRLCIYLAIFITSLTQYLN